MSIKELIEALSPSASGALARSVRKNPPISPRVAARVTTFNREGERAATLGEGSQDDFEGLKVELNEVVATLERSVDVVLAERRKDEEHAKLWIYLIGVLLVALVLISIAFQALNVGDKDGWLTTLFTGASTTGLLFMLYSPMQRAMSVANDRASLRMIPITFRMRVLTANTVDELKALTNELAVALGRLQRDEAAPAGESGAQI
jgi:hypothetical protein